MLGETEVAVELVLEKSKEAGIPSRVTYRVARSLWGLEIIVQGGRAHGQIQCFGKFERLNVVEVDGKRK